MPGRVLGRVRLGDVLAPASTPDERAWALAGDRSAGHPNTANPAAPAATTSAASTPSSRRLERADRLPELAAGSPTESSATVPARKGAWLDGGTRVKNTFLVGGTGVPFPACRAAAATALRASVSALRSPSEMRRCRSRALPTPPESHSTSAAADSGRSSGTGAIRLRTAARRWVGAPPSSGNDTGPAPCVSTGHAAGWGSRPVTRKQSSAPRE